MSFTTFIILFVIYSVLGWTIDTAYRTYSAGRYVHGGFIRLPFSPVYGSGAFLAILVSWLLGEVPLWIELPTYVFLLGSFEYLSGVFCVAVFKRRLWNYSKEPGNLHGHTAPAYAFAWGVLAILIIHVIHPFLLRLLQG